MSIAKALAKSRWKGAMLAAVTAASAAPAVNAAMTVNLSLAPLGSTAPKSLRYLTLDSVASSAGYIPIYVYATVTGTGAPTTGTGTSATAPVTTGDLDGLQYLYYNVLNSTTGSNLIAGGLGTGANAPVLTAPFNATGADASGGTGGGAQVGTVQNIAGGVSLGANASSVVLTDYAKPRAASAIFSNYATFNGSGYTYANNGTNVVVSGNSVSFLVETLFYKPTAYNGAVGTTRYTTTFSVQVPTLPATYTGANYFQDSSTSVATVGANGSSLAAATQTAYTAGTSVTFTDTALGDINADGVVNVLDFNILVGKFNQNLTGISNGDLNNDGVVNVLDFNLLVGQFNFTVGATPTVEMATLTAFAAAHEDTAGFQSALAANPTVSAVPEPATCGLLAVAAVGALGRRRRTA